MFAETDPAIAEPGTIAPLPAPVPIVDKAQARADLITTVGLAVIAMFFAALILKIAMRYRLQIDEPDDCNADRKSTRLNSSHGKLSRMPSSA